MRSVESHSKSGSEKEGMNEVYTPSTDRNSITIAENGSVKLDTNNLFDPNLLSVGILTLWTGPEFSPPPSLSLSLIYISYYDLKLRTN